MYHPANGPAPVERSKDRPRYWRALSSSGGPPPSVCYHPAAASPGVLPTVCYHLGRRRPRAPQGCCIIQPGRPARAPQGCCIIQQAAAPCVCYHPAPATKGGVVKNCLLPSTSPEGTARGGGSKVVCYHPECRPQPRRSRVLHHLPGPPKCVYYRPARRPKSDRNRMFYHPPGGLLNEFITIWRADPGKPEPGVLSSSRAPQKVFVTI